MSISLGIDFVCADEVQESMRLHGERYLERIWTEEELRDCQLEPSRLAAAFAAKEAAMKALRTGGEPVPWRSISVAQGQTVTLSGAAAEQARRRGIGELSVSTARRRGLAAAVVVAESGTRS
jgi:holo-[acyl-carrier protein] synthase